MKMNEKLLRLYITEAINRELNEAPLDGVRAQNGNSNVIRRIKETWNYDWNPQLTREQNLNNLKEIKKALQDAGYRDYKEYIQINGSQNDGEATTPEPDGNTTPSQPEPELKKYNPQDAAPFANVKSRVMQFQTWFNDQNKDGKYGTVEPLVVDGIWGTKTQDAWQRWLSVEGRSL